MQIRATVYGVDDNIIDIYEGPAWGIDIYYHVKNYLVHCTPEDCQRDKSLRVVTRVEIVRAEA